MSLFKRFFKFPLSFFSKRPDKDELMKRLTREQFYVTQQCGTEPPFRNEYWQHKEKGVYSCVVCDEELFSSEHKYDSGTGWPSFYDVVKKEEIEVKVDTSHGMIREEVTCKCGAHLGHRFSDGPRDKTGTRYCINSASLLFKNKL